MKRHATIIVIGKDKTEVIARITNFLFIQRANIEALEEQVTRGQFSMTVQASWNAEELNLGKVQSGLNRLAKELDMEIKLRFTASGRVQRMAIMATREAHCLERILKEVGRRRL